MPMQKRCVQCGMIFPNEDALSKHRTRFCIGVKDSGIGRKLNHSNSEYTAPYYSTDRPSSRRTAKYQSQIDKKRDEISDWKDKRSMLRDIKDMEDRMFYDSQKTRKLATNRKRQTDNYDYRRSEYDLLEAQERDLLRQTSKPQRQPGSNMYQSDGLTNHERNQLDGLKQENARLEQERRIIQIKLRKLMMENDQPDRNERSSQRFSVYPEDPRSYSNEVPALPYLQSPRNETGNEIRNFRNEYLQSGGHNAAVLARYADVERKLTQYEYYPSLKDRPEPLRRQRFYAIPAMPEIDTTTNRLTLARSENQRLQKEINDLRQRFQGLDSRTKNLELGLSSSRASMQISNEFYSDPPSQVNGYPPMNSLVHHSSRQTEYFRRNNRSLSPTDGRSPSPYAIQSYNQMEGFVIFFDFIANLSPSLDRIRLITCLHHEQTGLGEPSQLDSCKCELSSDERTGESMRIAFVATKQPVPRCPAQQALKILVETQVILQETPNGPFHTVAWTKMPIFDHNSRLLTGRWKIPLKALPIQHDERLSTIGSLPTFGSAELFYRLVNLRDAADQSDAGLLPKTRDLYIYPPQD